MAVVYKDRAYLFEFKVVELERQGRALEVLKERRYYEKYRGKYKEVWLIGVEFSKERKNIERFEYERIE